MDKNSYEAVVTFRTSHWAQCIGLLLALAPQAFASTESSWSSTFLLDTFQSPVYKDLEIATTPAEDKTSLSPVERVQLRLEADEDRKYQYGFRISPMSLEEYRATKALQAQQSQLNQLKARRQLAQELHLRYELIAQFYWQKDKLKHLQALKSLAQKEHVVVKRMKSGDATALEDILDSQWGLEDRRYDLSEATALLKQIESQIQAKSPELSQPFNQNRSLPSIRQLKSLVARLSKQRPSARHPDLQVAKLTVEKEAQEVARTTARETKILDFVELSMQQEERDQTLSFQLGLNIPGLSAPNQNVFEENVELREAQIESNAFEQASASQIQSLLQSLDTLIEMYLSKQSHLQQWMAKDLPRLRKVAKRRSPLAVINLEKKLIDFHIKQSDSALKIYESYIQLLYDGGFLLESPRVNYFSPQWTSLSGGTN